MDVGNQSRPESSRTSGGVRFNGEQRKLEKYRDACFLKAWKRGIRSVGLQYFAVRHPHSLELAAHRDQLCPDYAAITHALARAMTATDGLFLCALYRFYNAEEGERLIRRYYPECQTRDQILALLDTERRSILGELMTHYTDW